MKDPAWKVRHKAAESLGNFVPEAAKSVPALMDRLRDPQVEVRRMVILSLGKVALGKLGKDNDARVGAVVEALKKLTTDPDEGVRLSALIALAQMERVDDSVIPELAKAIQSQDRTMAKDAATALGKLGKRVPDKVLPYVLKALDTQDEQMAVHVLKVMRFMKAAAAPALPKVAALYDGAGTPTRIDIVDTVTMVDSTGDQAIPLLLKATRSSVVEDRRQALMQLNHYRSRVPSFFDDLKLALKDQDAENREIAVGLIRSNPEAHVKALPELMALLHDPEARVRRAAMRAVSSAPKPPEEVVSSLEQMLDDQDPKMRTMAVQALGEIGRTYPEQVKAALGKALARETHEPAKNLINATLGRLNSPTPYPLPSPHTAEEDRRPGEALGQ